MRISIIFSSIRNAFRSFWTHFDGLLDICVDSSGLPECFVHLKKSDCIRHVGHIEWRVFYLQSSYWRRILTAFETFWSHLRYNGDIPLTNVVRTYRMHIKQTEMHLQWTSMATASSIPAIQTQSQWIWSGFKIFFIKKVRIIPVTLIYNFSAFLKFPHQYGSNYEISAC